MWKIILKKCLTQKPLVKNIFPQIGPSRRNYVEGMGYIYFDMELGNVLYYEMLTEQDDGIFLYPIHFAQDLNGDWLIAEF